LSLLDHRAFLEGDVVQIPFNARADFNVLRALGLADQLDDDRHIATLNARDEYLWSRRWRGLGLVALCARENACKHQRRRHAERLNG